MTVAIAAALTFATRRLMFASAATLVLVAGILLVSRTKMSAMNLALHSYDAFFYLNAPTLRFLWESGIRPGTRLTVREVAPYAGTISVDLEGKIITMGLAASHKIWVYDPKEPQPKPRARSARTVRAER